MSAHEHWTNWSGNLTATPARIAQPRTESAIVDLVRAAAKVNMPMRTVGTGHSFVPLCVTDGLLFSLDSLQGVISTDRENLTATVWAGTKLYQLGEPLLAAGMAMRNLGDIDRQSVAGAISTGTHGTGPTLSNISSQVVGLRLVLASGEILDCSPEVEPEVFAAARVSLGALGVITRVTLKLLPAYRLHQRTWVESFDACMGRIDELVAATRHFEYFWDPAADACAMKAIEPTELTELGRPPAQVDAPEQMRRYLNPERIDWSYKILPSDRYNRCNEIEFAVPAASGPDCKREIRELMLKKYPEVLWPTQYRTLHSDDALISPAHHRETVAISVHRAAEEPYTEFFQAAEAIFRNHRGRPHWGKCHWHTAREFRDMYPEWGRFVAVRERLDPHGRFLNDHLRQVFVE